VNLVRRDRLVTRSVEWRGCRARGIRRRQNLARFTEAHESRETGRNEEEQQDHDVHPTQLGRRLPVAPQPVVACVGRLDVDPRRVQDAL
jgi:hypothetical protein